MRMMAAARTGPQGLLMSPSSMPPYRRSLQATAQRAHLEAVPAALLHHELVEHGQLVQQDGGTAGGYGQRVREGQVLEGNGVRVAVHHGLQGGQVGFFWLLQPDAEKVQGQLLFRERRGDFHWWRTAARGLMSSRISCVA